MIFTFASAGLTALLLLVTPHARAQENITSSCLEEVYDRLSLETRLFRSVLYGEKKSEDSPLNTVRFSKDYATWTKTAENEWRSLDSGYTSTTWSDMLMEQESDIPARRGLFEQKKTPTSDLIPPILQSVRAYQCRLKAVCLATNASLNATSSEVEVQPEGCEKFTLPRMNSCVEAPITQMGPSNCSSVADELLTREMRYLEAVIIYDGAYRSLVQFMGIFEGFLADFRFPLVEPLWQMLRALGSLDNLPCFNAQCDN